MKEEDAKKKKKRRNKEEDAGRMLLPVLVLEEGPQRSYINSTGTYPLPGGELAEKQLPGENTKMSA